MKTISISDIVKKPSILDNVDDVVQIIDKKKDDIKGFFISMRDYELIKDMIEEIEYQKWYKRNRGLENPPKDLDGILDEAIEQIGEKLP